MLRRTLPLHLSYTVHAAHLEQAHGTEAGRPSFSFTYWDR